jgi:hypothetical protein
VGLYSTFQSRRTQGRCGGLAVARRGIDFPIRADP